MDRLGRFGRAALDRGGVGAQVGQADGGIGHALAALLGAQVGFIAGLPPGGGAGKTGQEISELRHGTHGPR